MTVTDIAAEDRSDEELVLDLARSLAELTRDIVARDYTAAAAHLFDVSDRLDILAVRQRAQADAAFTEIMARGGAIAG